MLPLARLVQNFAVDSFRLLALEGQLPAVGLIVGGVEVDRDEPSLVPQTSPVVLDHPLEQSLAQSKEVLWPDRVLEAG